MKTSMNGFGGTARVNHNSSKFYARRLFEDNVKAIASEGVKICDNALLFNQPEVHNKLGKHLNTVLCKDSTNLSIIPDSSVHLMVTSPPYNVGKDYDKDMGIDEYLQMLDGVFAETYRILVNGGRACINIANVGRKPYIPFHSYIIELMAKNGFLMRGEVIWGKGAGAGTSTAWGSWMSATNPTLRDTHEYILIFSKGKFNRDRGENTITKDQFLEYTKSVWTFQPESAKKVNHPAPYPVELPYRCIQLYTFEGDVVFDPFSGSGSTAIAAIRSNRNFLMVDKSRAYAKITKERIGKELSQTKL